LENKKKEDTNMGEKIECWLTVAPLKIDEKFYFVGVDRKINVYDPAYKNWAEFK